MNQIKIFTGATPAEVQEDVSQWLKPRTESGLVHLVQVAPTDVVQAGANCGIQRFTLVVLYEVKEGA